MDSVFFQSVLISPVRIMGVKLRPFSAFHALLLLQFDSPFMREARDAKLGDLIFALNVLSSEWGDDVKKMVKCSLGLYLRLVFARKKTISQAMQKIGAHIDGYAECPEIWSKGDGKSSGVPWPFRIAATIIRHFPAFTEADGWNMGLSKAAGYRACFAEECGHDVFNEWSIEGRHKRWIKSKNYSKYSTLKEFEEGEGYAKCQK